MIERALTVAGIVVALLLAASALGGALQSTFAKVNAATAPHCEAHAKDTCRG